MFLFSYLNFMHIGKVIYFDNLQNCFGACNIFIELCIKYLPCYLNQSLFTKRMRQKVLECSYINSNIFDLNDLNFSIE